MGLRGPDYVVRLAQEFRRNPTPAEERLWSRLRKRALDGRRFRFQHVIHRYVLDFYCAEAKLAVELDGRSLLFSAEYDATRTKYCASTGIRIVRFSNQEVFSQLESVLAEIRQQLEGRRRLRNPPSHGG